MFKQRTEQNTNLSLRQRLSNLRQYYRHLLLPGEVPIIISYWITKGKIVTTERTQHERYVMPSLLDMIARILGLVWAFGDFIECQSET